MQPMFVCILIGKKIKKDTLYKRRKGNKNRKKKQHIKRHSQSVGSAKKGKIKNIIKKQTKAYIFTR